eukprot:CAMPEP_0194187896 /NCGR_PEP_ID=MMETSP0154-20130528/52787_1 /TAXON_ID=1049557 /ORGANISM="Thalassiothrix antarctica, Strain L6-D1" /LENGTH=114 /DNA_ID=CAMNT_0038907921 /DNA_START=433 /DNA_END=774 /DNA_ORIENTATION=+
MELEKKRKLLHSLTESTFIEHIARECQDRVSESKKDRGWYNNNTNAQSHASIFQSIISDALRKQIGDAGLSDEQKRNQIVSKIHQVRDKLQPKSQSAEVDIIQVMGLPSETGRK